MIRYDAQTTPFGQSVPEGGERGGELLLLPIHRHAERLEESGEVRRTRPRPQRLADRVHEVVARHEGSALAAAGDAAGQAPRLRFIGVLSERFREPLLPPGIEDVR